MSRQQQQQVTYVAACAELAACSPVAATSMSISPCCWCIGTALTTTNRKAEASFCARVASLLLASHKLLVSRWLH